jgi:hypothetical protein
MLVLQAHYEDLYLSLRWIAAWSALCLALAAGLWFGHAGKGWSMPLVGICWFAGWHGMKWATALPVRVVADHDGLAVEALRAFSIHSSVNFHLAWRDLTWFAVAPSAVGNHGAAQSEISVGTSTRKFLLVGDLREVQRFYVLAEELRTGFKWQGPPRRSDD